MHWEARAVDYFQCLGRARARPYYRCGRCRARRRLARELWNYSRPPRCSCGVSDWRLDLHRTKEQEAKTGAYAICRCDGYWYPHRPGSGVWCCESDSLPTIDDERRRYGV